jgi:hypothetical protein
MVRRPQWRSPATAVDSASMVSFFVVFDDPNCRTRADNVGGTSTTRSPAATSSWVSGRCSNLERCDGVTTATPVIGQIKPGEHFEGLKATLRPRQWRGRKVERAMGHLVRAISNLAHERVRHDAVPPM